jgi:hypothetical protein
MGDVGGGGVRGAAESGFLQPMCRVDECDVTPGKAPGRTRGKAQDDRSAFSSACCCCAVMNANHAKRPMQKRFLASGDDRAEHLHQSIHKLKPNRQE